MGERRIALSIGGSDSCGGAGIQADLLTFVRHGWHACTVITALTAQNPHRIWRIQASPIEQIEAEFRAIRESYVITVAKTGMLYDAHRIECIANLLKETAPRVLVVDPVLASTSGTALASSGCLDAYERCLFPMATLVTPNLVEAAAFLGTPIKSPIQAASELGRRWGTNVLLKGGHGSGTTLLDVLWTKEGGCRRFTHERLAWSAEEAHGTGCRLASAIAARLGHGEAVENAVEKAIDWLQSLASR